MTKKIKSGNEAVVISQRTAEDMFRAVLFVNANSSDWTATSFSSSFATLKGAERWANRKLGIIQAKRQGK